MLTTQLGPVEEPLVTWEKARTVVPFRYMLGEGRSEVERARNRTTENSKFRIVKKEIRFGTRKARDLRKPIAQKHANSQ
jgi:hypothetical protein